MVMGLVLVADAVTTLPVAAKTSVIHSPATKNHRRPGFWPCSCCGRSSRMIVVVNVLFDRNRL